MITATTMLEAIQEIHKQEFLTGKCSSNNWGDHKKDEHSNECKYCGRLIEDKIKTC